MAVLAGNIVRTTVSFALNDGTVAQNIFHHQRIGIGVFTDAAIVSAIGTWTTSMYGTLASLIKSDVLEQLCSVDRVEFVVTEWVTTENLGTFLPSFVPSAITDMLPNQVSAFVVLKTPRPKTVGRKFLIPFVEERQAGSYLEASAVTAVVAWADYAVNDIELQVGDYMRPGVPRTGVDDWQAFNVGVVTNLLGSQRRRRPGVGS